MRRAVIALAGLLLAGCHLLLPFGHGESSDRGVPQMDGAHDRGTREDRAGETRLPWDLSGDVSGDVPGDARAGITFVQTCAYSSFSAMTFSITCSIPASYKGGALFVLVGTDNLAAVQSVDCGASSLVRAAAADNAPSVAYIYYGIELPAPSTEVITVKLDKAANATVLAVVLSGADSSKTPAGTAGPGSVTSSPYVTFPSTGVGSIVLGMVATTSTDVPAASAVESTLLGVPHFGSAYQRSAIGTSTTLSWTLTSASSWVTLAVEVVPKP